jgi:hypothetical protein
MIKREPIRDTIIIDDPVPLKRVKPEPTATSHDFTAVLPQVKFFHLRKYIDSQTEDITFPEFFYMCSKFSISKEEGQKLLDSWKQNCMYVILNDKIVIQPELIDVRFRIPGDLRELKKKGQVSVYPQLQTSPPVSLPVISNGIENVKKESGIPILDLGSNVPLDSERKVGVIKSEVFTLLESVTLPVRPPTACANFCSNHKYLEIQQSILESEETVELDVDTIMSELESAFKPLSKNYVNISILTNRISRKCIMNVWMIRFQL